MLGNRLVKGLIAWALLLSCPIVMAFEPLDGDPQAIGFGIISTESTAGLKNQWEPLMADMQAAIGVEVKAFFASDYAGIIEGMRAGEVHVAWLGNKAAVEAVDRAGAQVFVQLAKLDGSAGYYSYLIAHADDERINTVEDVLTCDRSLDFGIGDPDSTSGFLVPNYYVFTFYGVDPNTCFKSVSNANHEVNLMAVAGQQLHVATNNSEQLNRTRMSHPGIANRVKIVWTSPLIPSDPMVYRVDLSAELKARIKAFFLGYGRVGDDAERARTVLAQINDGQAPFLDSDNSQLYPFRQLALYERSQQVRADQTLSAEDKASQLAEIDAELKMLKVLLSGW